MFGLKKIKLAIEAKERILKEITEEINNKTALNDSITAKLVDAKTALHNIQSACDEAQKELDGKKNVLQGYIELESELGYEFTMPQENSDFFTQEIINYEAELAEMVGNKKHYTIEKQYLVDGSKRKGNNFQTAYIKNIFGGFNAFFQTKKKIATSANLCKSKDLIEKSFEKCCEQASVIGIKLNKDYLWYCIKILNNTVYFKNAKAEEKEKIREEKRRLKEQEKLFEEAERAKRQLEKERKEYEIALAKSISEAEQKAIKEKLAEIDSREADIDYRITQQKAGWLYVITSKSLPNMCKIGCTRRLSPFERIKELSSASVPFPFVSRGIVFSEDVFALETAVHKRFDKFKVNKENGHKEFYAVDPNEVVDVLKKEFGCEVQFIREEDEEDT